MEIEIFVIDDDKDTTDAVGLILNRNGINNFRLFNNANDLLAALNDNVHICVVDYILNDGLNGLDLIKKIIAVNKHCWFIMLSGQAEIQVVIDYVNTVFGGRYIDKGENDLGKSLIVYLKEIIEHINFIESFYYNYRMIQEGFSDLKSILVK